MTQQFENMLYLFGANANGAEVKINGQLNKEQIRKYSIEQGIWTMVYPELAKLCDASEYRQEFYAIVSRGIMRKEFTLGILQKLEAAGIKCCLLKGAMLSPLYAAPECRISSDTDILIDEKDEKRATRLLLEYGYSIKERPVNHHHMTAVHKIGGVLEVHVRLYNEMTKKILFDDMDVVSQEWDVMEIDGNKFHILGTRDNLMYLTAHYIKHLINSGVGVRQMMDLLLYIEKNKDKIDFDDYEKTLKKLRYNKLINVVKSVGAKYFGFDYEIKHEELMKKVLADTEEGGIFGHSAENRSGFYTEYCKKRTTMSKAKSKIYMFVKKEGGYDWFPSQEKLIKEYCYKYARHKVLIPFAWIHRYIDVITGKRKPEIAVKDTNEFNNRMELMRELEMIE